MNIGKFLNSAPRRDGAGAGAEAAGFSGSIGNHAGLVGIDARRDCNSSGLQTNVSQRIESKLDISVTL